MQFGVVGFTLFLAVAFSAFRKTWAIWRSGPRNNATLAWVAALAVFLVAANFVDYAIDRKYLWYVLGLITLIALYGGAEEKASTPEVATAPARQAARLRLQGSRANR